MVMIPLRAGNSNRADYQALLQSLLAARGSAFTSEQGTIVYCETVAMARAIYTAWQVNAQAKNELNPAKVSVFMQAYEEMYGLTPLPTDNVIDRRKRLLAKILISGLPATFLNVTAYLQDTLGQAFFELVDNTDTTSSALVTSSTSIPNPGSQAITIHSPPLTATGTTYWTSTLCHVFVRLVQPTTLTFPQFINLALNVPGYLNVFLPAWAQADWFSFQYSPPGTITAAQASEAVTGNSTTFLSQADPLTPGEQIEVIDNSGIAQSYTIATISSDTALTITTPAINAITTKPYRIAGFVLGDGLSDAPFNLDISPFTS